MIRVLPDEYLKIFRRLHSCWRSIFLLPMVWCMYSKFTSSPAFDAQTMTVFGHAFRTEDLVESYFIAIGLSLAVLGFVFVVVLKVICPKCRTPLAYDVLHHLFRCRQCGDCFEGPPSKRLADSSSTGGAGGGGSLSGFWGDFTLIRLLPRDYPELVLRCGHDCLLLLLLHLAVVFALLLIVPEGAWLAPIPVFGLTLDSKTILLGMLPFSLVLPFVLKELLRSRFIRLDCPTCLRQLDYQSNGHHYCCQYCSTRWDGNSLVLRTPTSAPSPAAE